MLTMGKSVLKCNECKKTFIGDVISGGIVYMPPQPACTCPNCGSGNVSLIVDSLKSSVKEVIKNIIK